MPYASKLRHDAPQARRRRTRGAGPTACRCCLAEVLVTRASNWAGEAPEASGSAAYAALLRFSAQESELSRRQMTRIPAVGDAIPDDAVSVVQQELEVFRPCNPTSHDLGLALRRKEKGAAVHLDLPAIIGRLHAHDGGHVCSCYPRLATAQTRRRGASRQTSSLASIPRRTSTHRCLPVLRQTRTLAMSADARRRSVRRASRP
jgi:hypothetical protein